MSMIGNGPLENCPSCSYLVGHTKDCPLRPGTKGHGIGQKKRRRTTLEQERYDQIRDSVRHKVCHYPGCSERNCDPQHRMPQQIALARGWSFQDLDATVIPLCRSHHEWADNANNYTEAVGLGLLMAWRISDDEGANHDQ